MPWLYTEDACLKLKLQGLTVADPNNPARPVPVRFRLPEDELATLTYPCIVIEHLPTTFAPERAQRGYGKIPYAPEGYEQWWPVGASSYDPADSPYYGDFPIPCDLNYQVTVYSRKMAGHLEYLMGALAQYDYLPFQWGYLNVPQDGTHRTMSLISGPAIEYGKDRDNKRLFRAIYVIKVCSEIVNVQQPVLATQIDIDLGCYRDVTDLTTDEVDQAFGLISTGPALAWNVVST